MICRLQLCVLYVLQCVSVYDLQEYDLCSLHYHTVFTTLERVSWVCHLLSKRFINCLFPATTHACNCEEGFDLVTFLNLKDAFLEDCSYHI